MKQDTQQIKDFLEPWASNIKNCKSPRDYDPSSVFDYFSYKVIWAILYYNVDKLGRHWK